MFELVLQWIITNYHLLVTYPHFTKGCCIVAFCLFYFAKPEYKTCLKIISFEFLACQLAATIGLDLTRMLNPWGIYAVSGIIQLGAMLALFIYQYLRYKVSSMISLLVAFAGFVNIELALAWHEQGFTGLSVTYLYNIYADLLGGIMLFQLLFMLLCNIITNKRNNKNGYGYSNGKRMVVDYLFFVYPRFTSRDLSH